MARLGKGHAQMRREEDYYLRNRDDFRAVRRRVSPTAGPEPAMTVGVTVSNPGHSLQGSHVSGTSLSMV